MTRIALLALHGGAVYDPLILQRNERAIFEQMLIGFPDAVSLGHRKELALSPYWQTQRLILERPDELFDEVGGTARLAIVAQSLGGTPRVTLDIGVRRACSTASQARCRKC